MPLNSIYKAILCVIYMSTQLMHTHSHAVVSHYLFNDVCVVNILERHCVSRGIVVKLLCLQSHKSSRFFVYNIALQCAHNKTGPNIILREFRDKENNYKAFRHYYIVYYVLDYKIEVISCQYSFKLNRLSCSSSNRAYMRFFNT